jgi:hypothetical protein
VRIALIVRMVRQTVLGLQTKSHSAAMNGERAGSSPQACLVLPASRSVLGAWSLELCTPQPACRIWNIDGEWNPPLSSPRNLRWSVPDSVRHGGPSPGPVNESILPRMAPGPPGHPGPECCPNVLNAWTRRQRPFETAHGAVIELSCDSVSVTAPSQRKGRGKMGLPDITPELERFAVPFHLAIPLATAGW